MPEQNPQQHSELASFGEELRREREIRGISLKEIADATKISRRFLDAIERNDHKTLPAPVFTRGFVREYARYLGLNSEEMVNRYNFGAAGDDRIEHSDHLERLVHPEPAQPPKPIGIPPPYKRIDRNFILTIFIIAGLVAVTWWAVTMKRTRREAPAVVAAVPVDTAGGAAGAAQRPGAPQRPAAGEGAGAPLSTTAPRPARDDSQLYLTMEVTALSWVTLEVDGETVVNDELRAGTTRTFEAEKQFRFRSIGNAAGVRLTLNDTPLPPLGNEGDVVRNRVLDRGYLERLRRAQGDT